MKKVTLLFLLIGSTITFAQKAIVTDTLIAFYKKKAVHYLTKNDSLKDQYAINKKGISIFASADKKRKDSAEFTLSWSETGWFRSVLLNEEEATQMKFYNDKSNFIIPKWFIGKTNNILIQFDKNNFKDKKIAIDPGHIGGTKEDAKRERKMVDIKKDTLNGINEDEDRSTSLSSSIIEGNITMQTAMLLKQKLESLGAIVLLTRKGEGENAFGYSFETWMKKDLKKAVGEAFRANEINEKEKKKLLDSKTKPDYIFRYFFLQEELKQRAKLINAFHPSLTVVIHYNADENNLHGNKTGEKNFNMVFIPGSFMPNELATKRDRFEFVRLLASNDIENSEKASEKLINSFGKILNVPPAEIKDASYLSEKCLPTSTKGVFCRNLALTRFIHGTIIYGESLYQDNINEFKTLTESSVMIEGVKTNTRVAEVAEAYYQALLAIFQ